MNKQNLLSRAEMKKVMGGKYASSKDICFIKVTYADGSTGSDNYVTDDANGLCVGWITSGQVARCAYDCLSDGIGV